MKTLKYSHFLIGLTLFFGSLNNVGNITSLNNLITDFFPLKNVFIYTVHPKLYIIYDGNSV